MELVCFGKQKELEKTERLGNLLQKRVPLGEGNQKRGNLG